MIPFKQEGYMIPSSSMSSKSFKTRPNATQANFNKSRPSKVHPALVKTVSCKVLGTFSLLSLQLRSVAGRGRFRSLSLFSSRLHRCTAFPFRFISSRGVRSATNFHLFMVSKSWVGKACLKAVDVETETQRERFKDDRLGRIR